MTFMGNYIKPIVMEESFGAHTQDDIARAESWLKREGIVRQSRGQESAGVRGEGRVWALTFVARSSRFSLAWDGLDQGEQHENEKIS